VRSNLSADQAKTSGEQRVRFKILTQFHLEPHQIFGIVKGHLPTFIAAHAQAEIERWWRRKCVGFAQGNLVAAKQILLLVKLVILADHDPAVSLLFTPRAPTGHKGLPDPKLSERSAQRRFPGGEASAELTLDTNIGQVGPRRQETIAAGPVGAKIELQLHYKVVRCRPPLKAQSHQESKCSILVGALLAPGRDWD
jgi:hypothetical protein